MGNGQGTGEGIGHFSSFPCSTNQSLRDSLTLCSVAYCRKDMCPYWPAISLEHLQAVEMGEAEAGQTFMIPSNLLVAYLS